MDLADLRRSYTKGGLLESEVHPDPINQFRLWFEQARSADVVEPNAMALATSGPDVRMVLLKQFDSRGFVWYTNFESRKGRELEADPRAALLFYWAELERQVRICGTVEKVSSEEADAYFATRPLGHQLGAWASDQSSVVPGREALEARAIEVARRFENGPAPRPPYWGGYRLKPDRIEFWQGRPNRLHDRIEYRREPDSKWSIRRLAP